MFILYAFVAFKLVLGLTVTFIEWANGRMMEKTLERSIKRDGPVGVAGNSNGDGGDGSGDGGRDVGGDGGADDGDAPAPSE